MRSSKERPTLGLLFGLWYSWIKTISGILLAAGPCSFSDAVVQIYLDNAGDLELVARSIESSDLNFSRYGDTFLRQAS
ncbi:hypothetical protein FNV43_RR02901 [Rhamnella rubrinervis]|uniref:5MP1/2-like HEAT domain-containing protein n=1 Tax=Rhamnella rubrinervis TaxID=2594499 RepID=A0A8K0MNS3_9ROSA|nr:hypothetical protein FNV43_RR02901 [Rhamnella rubrinervis]